VIGKVCRRGTDTRRLLVYLFTEGAAGERGLDSEHRDARVIAGYDLPRLLQPERAANGRAQVARLAALLDAPVRAAGVGKDAKPVYHLAISAAPTDRLLSDAEWAHIAAQYVDRLGLARRGDSEAVRWVAVRHADNTCTPSRRWCARTAPGSHARPRRGGAAAASRAGPRGLRGRVRAALAGSHGWEEFADQLRRSGVLVHERYSTQTPGEITGYAVALPPYSTSDQGSVWFGGGKLAPDLSLPQLQARWDPAGAAGRAPGGADGAAASQRGRAASRTGSGRQQPAGDLSELERRRLWLSAQDAVRDAAEQIRHASAPGASAAERVSGQAAATAASEILHAVSTFVEGKRGGLLRAAADSYDRAARDLHRRTLRPTGSSRSLRNAAGALSAVRIVKRGETRQLLALLTQLAALSQSVGELRHVQARAAQASAARLAAEQLLAEHGRRAAHAAAVAPVQQAASVADPPPRQPSATSRTAATRFQL
jgi:hypothetical protein